MLKLGFQVHLFSINLKKVLNLLLFVVLIFDFSYAQPEFKNGKSFDTLTLKEPQNNIQSLEKVFRVREIPFFNTLPTSNTVFLQNSYASSNIINSKDWKPNVKNRKVRRIDIIFTKYPYYKNDWITNYYSLLAARLNELFAIDPSLNDSSIFWQLTLQTDCKTEEQAKQFFHGIAITFEILQTQTNVKPTEVENYQKMSEKDYEKYLEEYYFENMNYDQPVQYINDNEQQRKNKNLKCPDFSKPHK